jgi:isopenicillin N synthase-like dioxygenase
MSELPILDLSLANDSTQRPKLLSQLHDALFNVGFLYVKNHGIPSSIITNLTDLLPSLFDIPSESKARISKINSPHFLGYNGFAEETTLGEKDLREQFDFGTELDVVWREKGDGSRSGSGNEARTNGEHDGKSGRDFSRLFWRLRGPNQWPDESELPGFKEAYMS